MKAIYPQEKIDRIKGRYSDWIEEIITDNTDVPIFFVKKGRLLDFLSSIRTEDGLEYNFLADLTAYDDNPPLDQIQDYGLGVVKHGAPGGPRFVVVYQLYSLSHRDRIRVKTRVDENDSCPSATGLWEAANWLEREVFDMYGVRFSGHPNLKRILMDERWVGHPQRKDYPIRRYQRFEGSATLESFGLEDNR